MPVLDQAGRMIGIAVEADLVRRRVFPGGRRVEEQPEPTVRDA